MTSSTPPTGRHLRVSHFLVLVVMYLAIVQGTNVLLTSGSEFDYAEPTTIDHLVRSIVVPVGLSAVFALAVAAYLGRWDQVFLDRRPMRRWVLAVPVVLLVTVLATINYPGLATKGPAFALLLLVATLMVGFTEELVFRGVGVVVFRANGYSEFRVGLWTTLLFGLAHSTNVISAGPRAFLQVVLTSALGLVFYLVLRSTGALVAAMAAHGLWDFGVLSAQVDPENPWPLVNVAAGVLAVILVVVFVLRRRMGVEQPPQAVARGGVHTREPDSSADARPLLRSGRSAGGPPSTTTEVHTGTDHGGVASRSARGVPSPSIRSTLSTAARCWSIGS